MSSPALLADDTIAAIATATGAGGVGIVRLSGPRAIAIAADALGIAPEKLTRSVRLGWVRDPAGIQSWFDTWSGGIESKSQKLTIRVGGDLAYAFSLQHMTGTKIDGERVDLWFRATACFVRQNGGWKITHVHNSVPFAMDGSDRALLDLKPDPT